MTEGTKLIKETWVLVKSSTYLVLEGTFGGKKDLWGPVEERHDFTL